MPGAKPLNGDWEMAPRRRKKQMFDAAEANANHPPPSSRLTLPARIDRRRWAKLNAILIRINFESTNSLNGPYAAITAVMKAKVDLVKLGVSIERVRKTKSGNLLVEVGRG